MIKIADRLRILVKDDFDEVKSKTLEYVVQRLKEGKNARMAEITFGVRNMFEYARCMDRGDIQLKYIYRDRIIEYLEEECGFKIIKFKNAALDITSIAVSLY